MRREHFVIQRFVVGGVMGLMLLTVCPAHAYDDRLYDSYGADRGYDRTGGGRDGYSRSSEDLYSQQMQSAREYPPQTTQPQQGYGTPFGVSKSTAGALTGALLGAGTGAIIGSHKGRAGKGALIGAGLGAVGGYLTGRQIEARDMALDEQDQLILQQQQELAKNRQILEELKRQNLDARETDRGVVVNLPDVLFEFNSHRLTVAARGKVERIAAVLKGRAGERQVSIEGHTDSIGSESYNQALSEQRAAVVARELSFDGVQESRVTQRGFGERYPVAPNTRADGSDNPSGRSKNRRVEVVIAN